MARRCVGPFATLCAVNGVYSGGPGMNGSYTTNKIAGTIELRGGPGANIYNAPYDNGNGLTIVKQACATGSRSTSSRSTSAVGLAVRLGSRRSATEREPLVVVVQ
jgi:hypothetical protein